MKKAVVKVELVEKTIKAWDPEREVFYDLCLLPEYANIGDAGFDFRARLTSPVTLKPFQRALIPTSLKVQLQEGFEIQVRPRSGMALKHGITVLNTPGTIDSKFFAEIGVILINFGQEDYTIYPGERIAQGVLKEFTTAEFEVVDKIDETNSRGGGFGHSGKL